MSDDRWSTPIPLVDGAQVWIDMPRRLTEKQWEHFLAIMAACKPGLVAPESTTAPSEDGPPPAGPEAGEPYPAQRDGSASIAEGTTCENCDGVKCMDCRARAYHDKCAEDCPECCRPAEAS
jgi:hypothetical protein